jgi:hypothetical protein
MLSGERELLSQLRSMTTNVVLANVGEESHERQLELERTRWRPRVSHLVSDHSGLEADGTMKYSYHIVLLGTYMLNCHEARELCDRACQVLCYTRYYSYVRFIDRNVYSKSQHFRCPGSTKLGSSRPAKLNDERLYIHNITGYTEFPHLLGADEYACIGGRYGGSSDDGRYDADVKLVADEYFKAHKVGVVFSKYESPWYKYKRVAQYACPQCNKTHRDRGLSVYVVRGGIFYRCAFNSASDAKSTFIGEVNAVGAAASASASVTLPMSWSPWDVRVPLLSESNSESNGNVLRDWMMFRHLHGAHQLEHVMNEHGRQPQIYAISSAAYKNQHNTIRAIIEPCVYVEHIANESDQLAEFSPLAFAAVDDITLKSSLRVKRLDITRLLKETIVGGSVKHMVYAYDQEVIGLMLLNHSHVISIVVYTSESELHELAVISAMLGVGVMVGHIDDQVASRERKDDHGEAIVVAQQLIRSIKKHVKRGSSDNGSDSGSRSDPLGDRLIASIVETMSIDDDLLADWLKTTGNDELIGPTVSKQMKLYLDAVRESAAALVAHQAAIEAFCKLYDDEP